jgi:hypothetical protein
MSPGAIEEGGKAANAAIEALKGTPAILAILLFNLIFLFLVAYTGIKSNEHWNNEIERWAEFARACQNVTIRDKESERR